MQIRIILNIFPFLWPDSSTIPIVFKQFFFFCCNNLPWIAAVRTEPENAIASGQRAQGDERQTVVKESFWFRSPLTALGFKEREKTQKWRCSPTGWIVQDLNPWSPKPRSGFHHPKRFVQTGLGRSTFYCKLCSVERASLEEMHKELKTISLKNRKQKKEDWKE